MANVTDPPGASGAKPPPQPPNANSKKTTKTPKKKNPPAAKASAGSAIEENPNAAAVKNGHDNLSMAKESAKRTNPSGVRFVVPYGKLLDNLSQTLAGYLRFKDTHELKAFSKDPNIMPILDDWGTQKDAHFNSTVQNQKVVTKDFFTILTTMKDDIWQVVTSSEGHLTPAQLNLPATSNLMCTMVTISTLFTLLDVADEEHFPTDEPWAHMIKGHSAENWFRALYFLKNWSRQRGRNVSSERSSRVVGLSQSLAYEPVFLTDEDFSAFAPEPETGGVEDAAPTADQAKRDLLDSILQADGSIDEDGRRVQFSIDTSRLAEAYKLEDQFLLRSNANSGDSRKERSKRPAMTKTQVLAFCQKLGSKTKVIWGEEDNRRIRAELAMSDGNHQLTGLDLNECLTDATRASRADAEDASAAQDNEDRGPALALEVMRRTMADNSAPLPPFKDACKAVGVTPEDLSMPLGSKEIKYKVWQVGAIKHMLNMEQSTIRASILAFDCGAGKTLSLLGLVVTRVLELRTEYHEKKLFFNEDVGLFAPTLVVCPAASITVWEDEVNKCFPGVITVYKFYSTRTDSFKSSGSNTLPHTAEGLDEFLHELDPRDEKTGLTIVLTSYATWSARTLATQEAVDERAVICGNADTDVNEEDTTAEEAAPSSGKWKSSRIYSGALSFQFERVVCDEGHTLRNPNTLTSESIRHVNRKSIHFLSATPLLNRPIDMRGYLELVFKKSWRLPHVPGGVTAMYASDFDPSAVVDDSDDMKTIDLMPRDSDDPDVIAFVRAVRDGQPLYVLDPKRFVEAGRAGGWEPKVCQTILPMIMRLLMLRLSMTSEIDVGDGLTPFRIGDSVPECEVFTIWLQMSKHEKCLYDDNTAHYLSSLFGKSVEDTKGAAVQKSASAEESEGHMHQGIFRYLMHGTFDPRLCFLTAATQKKADRIKAGASAARNNWTGTDSDDGASYYYSVTRDGLEYAIPSDRYALANYIAFVSQKIKWILGKMAEWVLEQGLKVVMVGEFPMPQWLLEALLKVLSFEVVAITSQHSQEQRADMIRDFNDKDSKTKILLINTKLGSASLNLHHNCHKMIIFELPINLATLIQSMGRVHRLDAPEKQQIYILLANYSHDQICLHRIFRKGVALIAGEGSSTSKDIIPEAELKLQLFLGLEFSAYHEIWKWIKFDAKDLYEKLIRQERRTGSRDKKLQKKVDSYVRTKLSKQQTLLDGENDNAKDDKRREEAPCYHVSNANSVEHEEQDAADPDKPGDEASRHHGSEDHLGVHDEQDNSSELEDLSMDLEVNEPNHDVPTPPQQPAPVVAPPAPVPPPQSPTRDDSVNAAPQQKKGRRKMSGTTVAKNKRPAEALTSEAEFSNPGARKRPKTQNPPQSPTRPKPSRKRAKTPALSKATVTDSDEDDAVTEEEKPAQVKKARAVLKLRVSGKK